MQFSSEGWQHWHQFFANRSDRELPQLDVSEDYSEWPASIAASLAVFQLGESGGGTVVGQARDSSLPGINGHYGSAMALFVSEERRHANILAMCVRMLDGKLLKRHWTARLFVSARRLLGLRFKVMVLLAAEVVGICYYHLLASRMPACIVRERLYELVADERAHLYFHCAFLRSQFTSLWQRRLFAASWRILMGAAALTVMFDHRQVLSDLAIEKQTVWGTLDGV